MFRKESEFHVANDPMAGSESEEFADLQAQWQRALQERVGDHRPCILISTQDGRLHYALSQAPTKMEPLKTVQRFTTLRDDLAVCKFMRFVKQSPTVPGGVVKDVVTVIQDPRKIGIDPLEKARLVLRIIANQL